MKVAFILVAALLLSLQLTESRRSGGGSRSSGSSRRGWGSIFGRKKTKTSNPQSSYPKQQYKPSKTNYNNNNGGSNIGGGGFVAPKKNNYGGSNIGGGGFVGPKGNNYGGGGGGFSAPKYNAPRYQFSQSNGRYGGGVDMFGKRRGGLFSGGGGKAFALGAGAGFLGGAVAGIAAMKTYHMYRQMQMMLYYKDNGYYGGGYGGRSCYGSCPIGAYCDYGMCRCNPTLEVRYGNCFSSANQFDQRAGDWRNRQRADFDPFKPCSGHQSCFDVDINLYCNTNSSLCECRHGLKWNEDALECQIYMDVDCSDAIDDDQSTTTTPVSNDTESSSPTSSAEATTASTDSDSSDEEDEEVDLKTLTPNETLSDSKLVKLDVNKVTKEEIKLEFCREVKQVSDKYSEPLAGRYSGGNEYVPTNRPESDGVSTVTVVIIVVVVACIGFVACFLCKKKKSGRNSKSDADSMNMAPNQPEFQQQQAPQPQMYQEPMQQQQPYAPPPYQSVAYPPNPYQQAPYPAAGPAGMVGPPMPGAPAVPAAPGYAPSQPPVGNDPSSAPYPPAATEGGGYPPYPPQPSYPMT